MALVVRYFGVTANGAGDGTTWNDRAALFTGGAWSTVITGFAFNGSDALECRIGPGTHTVTVAMASGLFANPPTAVNSLYFHGCDSSGVKLTPPDPNWTSDLPAWDDSNLPIIATTTNIATWNLAAGLCRMIKFTASGRNGMIATAAAEFDWCCFVNSTANTAAGVLAAGYTVAHNCVMSCTGSSYSAVVTSGNSDYISNCRIVGVTGSSGNRDGLTFAGTNVVFVVENCTIISNGGRGFVYTGTSTVVPVRMRNCTIANNGGDGVTFPNTAAQTSRQYIDHCMITGNGGYGVNPGGANTNIVITQTRLRDNTSGNFNTFGNYPQDYDVYTTDSDDATEYVSTGSGNYQIKSGATIHGNGYGVSEQVSSSASPRFGLAGGSPSFRSAV